MTAGPSASPVPQLHHLTGLRGLAAWLVVFYHMRGAITGLVSQPVTDVFAKGYLAVDLFFMLSGFVMWLNYGEKLRNGGWAAARQFWWKRVARIWPLHLLVLAGMGLFVLVLAATGRGSEGYPLHELPLHILLMQNWGFTDALSWNHPAWSISTELAAYLVFPAVVIAARWEQLSGVMIAALVVALLAALHAVFALAGYQDLGAGITRLGLVRCLTEFLVGALLCILWQRTPDNRARTGLVAGVGAALVVASGIALDLPETLVAPAAMAGGLLSLALARGQVARVLASPLLRWLGDISYATYLSHFFLLILFKIVFVGDDGQLSAAGAAGYIALVLAASAVLYHGFEKPAQRWVAGRAPRGFSPDRAAQAG